MRYKARASGPGARTNWPGASGRRFARASSRWAASASPIARGRSIAKAFSDIGLYENSVYPDIEHVLATLHGSPRRLFVATSKPRVFAERIIDHFGLTGHFEYVFGSELDGTRFNMSELLAYAIETTGVDAYRTLMIGDRSHDMVGARNNGMGAVGVLYGYGSREELVAAGARDVCATPRACSNISAARSADGLKSRRKTAA